MNHTKRWMPWALALLWGVASCSPGARYDRKLARELQSGERYDSLFMGLYLGMDEKDFYTHCWELNREGLIRQGSSNMSVEYKTGEELKHPATMNFYPVFQEGKIVEMPVRFAYNGWAPWNKELSPEKLAEDIRRWYEKVYGEGFITVKHPEHGTAFVKVDGNRRITIFHEPDLHAWAIFTDMAAAGALKDSLMNDPIIP
jgi:hypothetical protein